MIIKYFLNTETNNPSHTYTRQCVYTDTHIVANVARVAMMKSVPLAGQSLFEPSNPIQLVNEFALYNDPCYILL